jgi:O-antigen/teichoic acid export membrane protein
MRRALNRLPTPVVYALSVGLEKSFSLVTIPLMAAYLPPSEFGDYDVAIAFVEFAGLIAALGLTDQLVRFASTADNEADARRCMRELLGSALLTAFALGLLTQALAGWAVSALSIQMDTGAMRALLLAACATSLISLPLMWLRLKEDAGAFMMLVVGRTLLQVAGLWIALHMGYGAEGVMVSNAVVLLLFAAFLTVLQLRKTGAALSPARLAQVVNYGAPIVGGALAMFALGNANRLFLPDHVSSDDIGLYGLAMRIALATWLLVYPFQLWWNPKRISALRQPGGLEYSARAWGIGVGVLIFSATGVGLAGPALIALAFPEPYAGAGALVPLTILAQCLHTLGDLSSTGSFARDTGYRVLLINWIGAGVAIAGYVYTVPIYGVYGAIGSIIVGETVRLVLCLIDGAKLAPIPYPWRAVAFAACAAVAILALAPPVSMFAARAIFSAAAMLALAVLLVRGGLIPITPKLSLIVNRLTRHAAKP